MKKTLIWLSLTTLALLPLSILAANAEIQNIINQLLQDELQQSDSESIYVEPTTNPLPDTSDELSTAVTRIHELGITKFDTPTSYMATNNIRRDEAATMFLRFARHHDMLGTALISNCSFPDLGAAHSDLTDEIVDACEAGLFQWSKWYFLPTASITNAQAITVMARILEWQQSEDGRHWADNYYDVLQEKSLMDKLPMAAKYMTYDKNITRGDIAILLYRADMMQ